MIVRAAVTDDLVAVVEILERNRIRLEAWEPNFWRKSSNSSAMSRVFLGALIEDPNSTLLIAEVDGAIQGCLQFKPTFVPPVYSPHGTTWMIDDFVVPNGRWTDVGAALLKELRARTIDHQEGQLILAVPIKDSEASSFFQEHGLNQTTSWWTVSS